MPSDAAAGDAPLLAADDLIKDYAPRATWTRRAGGVRALDGVSLALWAGETVGLVGESGCGKSTLVRVLLRLVEPSSGRIRFDGADWLALRGAALRARRPAMQVVFQDAAGALHPRKRIESIVGEALTVHGGLRGAPRRRVVADWLLQVGLPADAIDRFPHELSLGQQQRVGIARSLALAPRLLVCDEPVASLDLVVRAQILDLLHELRTRHRLAILFVTHDLGVARQFCDRVLVMHRGRIVESGPAAAVLEQPLHPYTRVLEAAVIDARAGARPQVAPISGAGAGDGAAIGTACGFADQCAEVRERCRRERPPFFEPAGDGGSARRVACFLHDPMENA